MRRATTALLAVCLVAFAALSASAEPPPPTYPIDQFLDAFQNTERSFADREGGRYAFDAGVYGTARRVAQRYPARYTNPDLEARQEAQVAVDALTHNRPKLLDATALEAGHPAYMPDWDHDGIFGDAGGYDPADDGDYDVDTDASRDTAYFLFPCYTPADEWQVHHRFASGACDVADSGAQPYAIGVAHEVKVINARGLVLDATLWLPVDAFAGKGCPAYGSAAYRDDRSWAACVTAGNLRAASAFPGVVFANGFSSRQEYYYWFAMRMVDEGYVVLTYDPAGQGESEGTGGTTIGIGDEERVCDSSGACRDLQDMVRWFAGRSIMAVPDRELRIAPRRDPASNEPNPTLPVLDVARLSLAGNSMGAISTLSYLDYLGGGAGADGRPLPPVVAAVALAGTQKTRAVVPIQFQTTDGDGSHTFIVPKIGGLNLGYNGTGIGYELVKEQYDHLRTTKDPSPLSLVVIESGTHSDHVNEPYVPRPNWSLPLAGDYAADWLNCHARRIASACASTASARSHLSRVYASEQDPDGPDGPSQSRCIRAPDAWSLNQAPDVILDGLRGSPRYDCTP